jgi:tRNA G18 (ribose-2'-O)-methylase SpoU
VGSIFRTADAAGVEKIYLIGTTPTPIDRFGRERSDIAKVALGAEKTIPWEYSEDIENVLGKLKKDGVTIVSVEQHERSINYTAFKSDKDVAFIFGEETKGIPEEVLTLCESIVEIPMKGQKESLNVSVTAGVILFRFIEQSL